MEKCFTGSIYIGEMNCCLLAIDGKDTNDKPIGLDRFGVSWTGFTVANVETSWNCKKQAPPCMDWSDSEY